MVLAGTTFAKLRTLLQFFVVHIEQEGPYRKSTLVARRRHRRFARDTTRAAGSPSNSPALSRRQRLFFVSARGESIRRTNQTDTTRENRDMTRWLLSVLCGR